MSGQEQHPEEQRDTIIPRLGLGTWENTDPDQCATSVATALETGYRHIDTAQAYGNEAAVGTGIETADIGRDDIFLATKVWIDNLAHNDVIDSTKNSLDRLNTDYLDLLYVHWPARTYDPEETLTAFQELKDDGYIRHIGVSNFEPRHIDTAIEILDEPPLANQVECHPFLQQQELRDACAERNVELVGYSPLARGEALQEPTITEIAADHDVSPAQVTLAWLRQADIPTIPKATSTDHIRDNWNSRELTLSEEEIEEINQIDTTTRQVDPQWAPWNQS